MTSVGIGTRFGVILPYRRLHKSRADHLGLVFMAMAGYDSNAAVAFWLRMEQKQGSATPEFLSTHPLNQARIDTIKKARSGNDAVLYKNKTITMSQTRNAP